MSICFLVSLLELFRTSKGWSKENGQQARNSGDLWWHLLLLETCLKKEISCHLTFSSAFLLQSFKFPLRSQTVLGKSATAILPTWHPNSWMRFPIHDPLAGEQGLLLLPVCVCVRFRFPIISWIIICGKPRLRCHVPVHQFIFSFEQGCFWKAITFALSCPDRLTKLQDLIAVKFWSSGAKHENLSSETWQTTRI